MMKSFLNIGGFITFLGLCILMVIGSCKSKDKIELAEACYLKPDNGPCKAAIMKYYYHPGDKKCKTFTWGGCQGVVPFDTLEDCQKGCNCD